MLKNTIAGTFAFCLISFLVILGMASRLKPKPPPQLPAREEPAAEVRPPTPPVIAGLQAPELPNPIEALPPKQKVSAEDDTAMARHLMRQLPSPMVVFSAETPEALCEFLRPGGFKIDNLTAEQRLSLQSAIDRVKGLRSEIKKLRHETMERLADKLDQDGAFEIIDPKNQEPPPRTPGVKQSVLSRPSADGSVRQYVFNEREHPEVFEIGREEMPVLAESLLRDAIAAVREGSGE